MRPAWLRLALVALALLALGFEWEGRLHRLQRELEHADAARRREVVRLLSSYAAEEVREPLLAALSDPDPGVRAEAARAAGEVQLDEAVPRLLDWLDDAESSVRTSAAEALGQIGQPRAVPELVRALGDSNARVRRTAVRALATIGSRKVVVPLLGRLDDTNATVRAEAAEALGRLGEVRAVVPLIGRARDDSAKVRIAVYQALGRLGDERAVPALLQGLRDRPLEARLAAVGALGQLGSEAGVDPLAEVAEGDDSRAARAAVASLGAIGTPDALERVIDALARDETRATAADILVASVRRGRSLGESRSARPVVTRLSDALAEADRAQATAIAEVAGRLAEFGPTKALAPALLRALREGRGRVPVIMNALASTGAEQALVPLLERVRGSDTEARGAALDALGRYFDRVPPDGRAADPLLSALGRASEAHRVRIVRLLGRVGAARALPALRPLLDHQDAELRLAAVQALGRIGDPEAAPGLLELLGDREARVRFEAAEALASAATVEVAGKLVERLLAREPQDRHALARALGGALRRLRRAEGVPAELSRAAREALATTARGADRALAARCIDALSRWGAPPAAETVTTLLDEDLPPALVRQLTLALGSFDTPGARNAARQLVREADTPVRAAAAAALGEHGTAADASRLFDAADAGAWPVAAAASFALARLARRGVLTDDGSGAKRNATNGTANTDRAAPKDLTPQLCELASLRAPYVRANAAVALTALGGRPCPDGSSPRAWLGPRHAPAVRAAAVRWLAAQARAGHLPANKAQNALDECIEEDLAPEVVDVCRDPSMPPLRTDADVYAYGSDGRTLLTDRLVALRLGDGSTLVARTDLNGHIWLAPVPRGRLIVDDPTSTPLEP